ncbi:hypothetical protein [Streptomyces albireticuli]|uniref:hypothetical protein n=1 Tax=Streptomyces albireticuli TaxID=1940 RepID=UPI0014749269|nr:hypothetical protein [Streptomyces albireticuli]MCD9143446.1 hypothetical protein [Streptomyces albireticuli]MCD9164805.1 hypothetical protein [Streptomyces albireticuli]MCD9191563.1 hypothetical protein [Streptomyces albireticuli]
MSENETRLSMVLTGLRKVTGPTTDEDRHRVALYLDSIEVEMDRIRADRDLTGERA